VYPLWLTLWFNKACEFVPKVSSQTFNFWQNYIAGSAQTFYLLKERVGQQCLFLWCGVLGIEI